VSDRPATGGQRSRAGPIRWGGPNLTARLNQMGGLNQMDGLNSTDDPIRRGGP
jgi:hypothetical protein